VNRRSRRVDRWIDDLLHGRRPRRMRGAEEEADVLRAAIEMRMATPDAGLPDPRFVESLRQRVARETQGQVPHAGRITRRALLASGGLAAATAAAGVVVGERLSGGPPGEQQLVPDAAAWIPVANLADVPPGSAMPFSTPAVRGFLVNSGGQITALSGVCTHLGCMLRLDTAQRRLDCPCHRAAFAFDGSVVFHSIPQGLPPLPQISARVREGTIEVLTV
jgi:nitrite reductase/ring-hydroxylating ferredoxin subunit